MSTSETRGTDAGEADAVVALSEVGMDCVLEAADWGAHITATMVTAAREQEIAVRGDLAGGAALYGATRVIGSIIILMNDLDVIEAIDEELATAIDKWTKEHVRSRLPSLEQKP